MQKESMDKPVALSEAGSGEVGRELKRNIWIVSAILALVLMIASWKEFVLPELATAFTSAHPDSNVSNLLMIVGTLASVCIILTIVMIAVLYKMYALSKQIMLVELEVSLPGTVIDVEDSHNEDNENIRDLLIVRENVTPEKDLGDAAEAQQDLEDEERR